MTRWTPLPIVGGAYRDDALPWSQQDCLNYIPVIAEKAGTRSPQLLRDAPGLDLFASALASAPIRGLYDVEGRLLAVAGTTLYKVSTSGAPTSLGTIPGVGRVTFAHNQVAGGNQVAIANGQSGYVYDTRDDSLAQITDDAFPGFKAVAFKDQFILGVEPAGRYWFHSDLADALSYSTLDRAEAETAPDRIVTLIVSGDDVVVLGERTGQFFFNTGDAEGTFENRAGTAMTVGAASPWCAATLDNTVYWLGHDGSVYRLAGYTPQRVSTHAIEQAIAACDIAQAFAFTYEAKGHKVYYLTLPDGHTWGFDVATHEWHRRGSYTLDRWRLSALVKSGRAWIGGDYATGLLYTLSDTTSHENGEPLERRRIGQVVHDDDNALLFNGFRVNFNTGADHLAPPSIIGDVPGGDVGDTVSGAYTVTGGVLPYGPVTVLSGTFPPGLTLDEDGSYSGIFTIPGSYAWTVGGVDAVGQPFLTVDTAVVASVPWIGVGGLGGEPGSGYGIASPDGFDWSGPQQSGLRGSYIFSGAGKLVRTRNAELGQYSDDVGATWQSLVNGGNSPGGGYFAGVFFTSHSDGLIRRSLDGLTYTSIDPGTGTGVQFMAAIPGVLIAASTGGPGGTCSRSADIGLTWGSPSNPLGSSLFDVLAVTSNGVDRFLAVGEDNRLATSANGSAWTLGTSPFAGSASITQAHWNGSVFIIANAAGEIAYSPTGLAGSWTVAADTFGAEPFGLATWAGRTVMHGAAGAMKATTDAHTWTAVANNFGIEDIEGMTPYRSDP